MNDFYVVRLRKIIAQCFPIAIDLYDDASFDDNPLPWKFTHQILDWIDTFLQSICVFIKIDKNPSVPDFAQNRTQSAVQAIQDYDVICIWHSVYCAIAVVVIDMGRGSKPFASYF